MRTLDLNETGEVAGGTFGLLKLLFCKPAPKPVYCAPAPAPKNCEPPKPKHGKKC